MALDPHTAESRDDLVRRAIAAQRRRFPKGATAKPSQDDFYRASDDFYLAVADYFDGLPRVTMSACPFCAQPLVRSFDPWGLDGPWWGLQAIYAVEEPEPCEHFRALLGALRLAEAHVPSDMLMTSQPGPEVPFVVPHLLGLPAMIAVAAELPMERGGPAYPVAYFSDVLIDPVELHQSWCRAVLWFERDGQDGWTLANDTWDFDLGPYLQSGQLRWVQLDAADVTPLVRTASDGARCPLVGLPGERRPQSVSARSRIFLEPPDGTPADPFDG